MLFDVLVGNKLYHDLTFRKAFVKFNQACRNHVECDVINSETGEIFMMISVEDEFPYISDEVTKYFE